MDVKNKYEDEVARAVIRSRNTHFKKYCFRKMTLKELHEERDGVKHLLGK